MGAKKHVKNDLRTVLACKNLTKITITVQNIIPNMSNMTKI